MTMKPLGTPSEGIVRKSDDSSLGMTRQRSGSNESTESSVSSRIKESGKSVFQTLADTFDSAKHSTVGRAIGSLISLDIKSPRNSDVSSISRHSLNITSSLLPVTVKNREDLKLWLVTNVRDTDVYAEDKTKLEKKVTKKEIEQLIREHKKFISNLNYVGVVLANGGKAKTEEVNYKIQEMQSYLSDLKNKPLEEMNKFKLKGFDDIRELYKAYIAPEKVRKPSEQLDATFEKIEKKVGIFKNAYNIHDEFSDIDSLIHEMMSYYATYPEIDPKKTELHFINAVSNYIEIGFTYLKESEKLKDEIEEAKKKLLDAENNYNDAVAKKDALKDVALDSDVYLNARNAVDTAREKEFTARERLKRFEIDKVNQKQNILNFKNGVNAFLHTANIKKFPVLNELNNKYKEQIEQLKNNI